MTSISLLSAIDLHLPSGFSIEKKIGEGATAWVYVATRADGDERLVVKVMRPGSVSAESVDRFLREMQTLMALQHDRIIPLLDAGEANGAMFFTMPYRQGETLRTRLARRGRLPVAESLQLASDVVDAMCHAHERGVVHRDIKPENIFTTDEHAFLMDFGFANVNRASVAGRSYPGTPFYMSPEQVAGKRAPDRRTDIYSLGCVLYEMLAGTTPFHSHSRRDSMSRRLKEDAPDVRAARPDVPDSVAAVIRRCLARDPSGRYPTAGALRSAIRDLTTDPTAASVQ
jgi:serine/threonine-protein kinase